MIKDNMQLENKDKEEKKVMGENKFASKVRSLYIESN